MMLLDYLLALSTVGLLVCGAASFGLPFVQWGEPTNDPLTQVTRSVGCGFVLLGYLTPLLGLLHAISPGSFLCLLAAPLMLPNRASNVVRLLASASKRFVELIGLDWAGRTCLLTIFILTACSLTPNTHYDVNSYHYAFPQIYLRQGSMDWSWANYFQGQIQSVHMLYLMTMALGGELASNLLGPVFALILVSTAMQICEHQEARSSWIAAALLLSSPVILLQGLGGLTDLPLSAYTCLALAEFLKDQRQSASGGWCAFWCGAALCCKLTALPAILSLIIALPWTTHRRPKITCSLLILVPLIMVSPWWIRNYAYTGDPFSPLNDWPSELNPWNFLHLFIPSAHAQSLPMTEPQVKAISIATQRLGTMQDWSNPLIWLTPLWLLFDSRRGYGGIRSVCYAAMIPLLWLCTKDPRYGLPLLVWWAIATAIALTRSARCRTRLVTAALMVSALPGSAIVIGLITQRAPVFLGLTSRQEFLGKRGPQSAYQFLEREVGSGKRALVLGRLGFRCPIDYMCADSLPNQVRLLDSQGLVPNHEFQYLVIDLRDRGILRSILRTVIFASPKRLVRLHEIQRGPLVALSSQQFKEFLVSDGFATEEIGDHLLLQPPESILSGRQLDAFMLTALLSRVVFSHEGVVLLDNTAHASVH